jgi:hypothetical protein
MKLTKNNVDLLNEIVDKSLDMVVMETADYQEFFKSMLQKYGVKSPMQLKGEQRKKFFSDVKAGWSKQKKNKK